MLCVARQQVPGLVGKSTQNALTGHRGKELRVDSLASRGGAKTFCSRVRIRVGCNDAAT